MTTDHDRIRPRRDLLLLSAAIALGLLVRLVYVLATWDHQLAVEELEYHTQGAFIADGKWFWSSSPYGIPHPSAWKTPGYPLFVGLFYSVVGEKPDALMLFQVVVFGAVTITLTWLLGRRLFGSWVGTAAAFVAALHPFVWQFEGRVFAEGLATPLTLAILLLVLDRRPSVRAVGAAGALAGLLILVKPSALHILAAVAAAIFVGWGWRGGAPRVALAFGVCVLVIAPWTIRNYAEFDAFVPLSVQDAGLYGVFNDDAAHDEDHPWLWRPRPTRDLELLDPARRLSDDEFRAELRDRGLEYIRDHPASVPKALFWNGLSRFWDVRDPSEALDEASLQGRSRAVTSIGLVIWWVVLPLGLAGLWLARSRRGVVLPVAVMFVLATFVYFANSGTRYRAPFEPVMAVFACSAVAAWRTDSRRFWDRRAKENPWFFISNEQDYSAPDIERFWVSGERDLDAILDTLDAELGASADVVEIGCGAGRMTRAIARRAGHVTALDVSPRMLDLAREQNAGLDNVDWTLADGRTLAGIPDASADVCISHIVFQHIPDPDVTLGYVREMGRVLRPGGVALFQVSNAPEVHRAPYEGPRRRWSAVRGRWPRGQRSPAWVGSAVDLDDLHRAASEAGLEVNRVVGEKTQYCFVRARRG
jgi:SAM-dependent methyltransferase